MLDRVEKVAHLLLKKLSAYFRHRWLRSLARFTESLQALACFFFLYNWLPSEKRAISSSSVSDQTFWT